MAGPWGALEQYRQGVVLQIRNPTPEIRRKPEIRSPKTLRRASRAGGSAAREWPTNQAAQAGLPPHARWALSDFGIRVSFGFRVSVFGFRRRALGGTVQIRRGPGTHLGVIPIPVRHKSEAGEPESKGSPKTPLLPSNARYSEARKGPALSRPRSGPLQASYRPTSSPRVANG